MQFEAQREQMRQAAAAAAASTASAAPPQAPPAAADTGAAPMNIDTETKASTAAPETKASAPVPAAAAPDAKAALPAPAAAAAPEAKAAAPAVPETKAEPSIPFEKLKASIATMKSLLSADGDPSLDFVCKRATEGDVEAFDHLMQMLKRSKRAKNDHVATAASADPVPTPQQQQQPPPRQVNMSGWMPGHTPTSATSAGQASRPLDTTAPSARVRQVVMCMADEAMTTASPLKDFEKRAVNWNAGPAGESMRKAFQDALDQWTMVQARITHGSRVLAAANRNSTAILASADECVYGTPYEKYGIPATLPEVAGQMVMSWHEGPDRARALALYNENKRQRQKQALMHGRGDDSVY